MCRFKSAIAILDESHKDGFRLLSSPWTESHSDLIALHNLRDNDRLTFARVEFYPDDPKDLADPAKFALRIDEERTPDWFTEERQARCAEIMRGWIKAMIVTGDVALLVGGRYILAAGAKIECAKNCIIHAMLADSSVRVMRESASVGVMRESASVRVMRGSASVGVMWESASVGEMWESASVRVMRGSASVREMWGSASVGEMWESASVGVMRESASVRKMWESASVGEMWESASVGEMWESASVRVMRGSANLPTGKQPQNDYRDKQ